MRYRLAPLFLLLLVACGGADRKQAVAATRSGLSTALAATNAARDTYLTWSRAHELELVAGATSRADGEAKLAAYRARSQRVVGALVVAYTSIAAADAALALAAAQPTELAGAIRLATDALAAVVAVRDAVVALKTGGS